VKTLFLVRHAKSSWDDDAVPDRERPLAGRGQRDAPEMGKRLARCGVRPDLMLSSPALRARRTAELIAEKIGYEQKNLVIDDRLYGACAEFLFDVIRGLNDQVKSAMLFGHNPELTELARRFSGAISHMPTCAVAQFTFDATSWKDVGPSVLAKVSFDFPKNSSA